MFGCRENHGKGKKILKSPVLGCWGGKRLIIQFFSCVVVFDWVSGGSRAHLDTNVDQLVERERARSSCFYSSYFWYIMFLLFIFLFVVGDEIEVFGTGELFPILSQ